MTAARALLPELQSMTGERNAPRRDAVLRQLADLFAQGAPRFAKAHVELFDGVFSGLMPASPVGARAHLAQRMAPLFNAPPILIGTLASDDEIAVAGPVLSHSPVIDEPTLVSVATSKGQRHLQAISIRATVTAAVTDIIVRRGDHEVVRCVARNSGARFSQDGFSRMIRRASEDDDLAVSVSHRDDLADDHLTNLLTASADALRQRMLEAATAERRAAIAQAIRTLADASTLKPARRNFTAAQASVLALHRAKKLDEPAVLGFAKARDYEACVVALAAMSGLSIASVDQFMASSNSDPIILLCKAVGISWPCVRTLLLFRLAPERPLAADVESARLNYEQLVAGTARRVVTFWRHRGSAQTSS